MTLVLFVTGGRQVPSRGLVIGVTCTTDTLPVAGEIVVRDAAGAAWSVTGIDRWAANKFSWKGCPIGLLVDATCPVVAGDSVTIESA